MLATGDNPVAGTLNATTSAAAIGSQACAAVLVQNDPGSSNNLLIGDSTNQYFSLKAGQALLLQANQFCERLEIGSDFDPAVPAPLPSGVVPRPQLGHRPFVVLALPVPPRF